MQLLPTTRTEKSEVGLITSPLPRGKQPDSMRDLVIQRSLGHLAAPPAVRSHRRGSHQ
jgi:hypothetical protein